MGADERSGIETPAGKSGLGVRSWHLVDPHQFEAGSNFHVGLIDLCDALDGLDLQIVYLIMGGLSEPQIANELSLPERSIKARILRLRRAVQPHLKPLP